MATQIKNIDLVKNLIRHDYDAIKELKFNEGIPDEVVARPWECSLGQRWEDLYLRRYSMAEGFSYVDLPQQWQPVSARGTYCKVSSFTKEWAKDNLKGTFVLIKYLSPGSWEVDESKGESTYDEYVTAWIFEL